MVIDVRRIYDFLYDGNGNVCPICRHLSDIRKINNKTVNILGDIQLGQTILELQQNDQISLYLEN